MIKALHLRTVARSREDFDLLLRLLASLGLESRAGGEEDRHYRRRSFSAPEAVLELLERPPRRPGSDLELTVSDPDSAVVIARKMGLEVVEAAAGGKAAEGARHFGVKLPGGTRVGLIGPDGAAGGEVPAGGIAGNLDARGKSFVLVVARFNSFITERLLAGALDGLRRTGARAKDIAVVHVPGAFEIPSAARTLASTRNYDALVCIGCLLRGDTAHYDVIVNEVTRGIGQSAQETGVPHAFGVLTCDTLEQAIDRAGLKMGNKGFEAALAAVEMAALGRVLTAAGSPAGTRAAAGARGKSGPGERSARPRPRRAAPKFR